VQRTRPNTSLRLSLLLCSAVLSLGACGEEHGEGYLPGQCEDAADNDADGLYDCNDPDCDGAAACQPGPPLDACEALVQNGQEELSCLVVAELTVSPPQVAPGESYTVNVWIPHGEADNPLLRVAGNPSDPGLDLAGRDGGLAGEVTLVAAGPLGDQLIAVEAVHDEGSIAGYAMLYVSALGPCPEGQVREAGLCVEPASGLPLLPTSLFHTPYSSQITDLPPDGGGSDTGSNADRKMLHPRRVFQVEEALVACLTDSVAVIDPNTMFPVSVDAGPDGPKRPEVMERAEGLLDPDGLAFCDDLAIDSERRLAVTMTRGALAQPAGLTSWQLPDLSSPPFDDPVRLDTAIDARGFEGGTYADGYLYVSGKPDRLAVFSLASDGALSPVSETLLPGSVSAWAVLKEGGRLYVSDAGTHPERTDGEPQGGTLFILGLDDPAQPQLLGSITTHGLGKSLAASGDGRVAVAGGETGLEIFDVSDPGAPQRNERIDTPGSAISVAWSGSYLLLSDWNSIRLYDSAEHEALRLLWATDLALTQLGGPVPDPEWAMDNSGFTALSGDQFIITEMDTIFLGQLQAGRSTASLNLVDRRWSLAASQDDQDADVVVRFRNGGRLPLDVTLRQQDGLSPSGQRFLVEPGGTRAVEVHAEGLLDNPETAFVWLDSNDPVQDNRRAALVVLEGGLTTGAPIPEFRLPMTNICEGEVCTQVSECFHLDDAQWQGMPILLAFYTSW
jgi:hypothetical protein